EDPTCQLRDPAGEKILKSFTVCRTVVTIVNRIPLKVHGNFLIVDGDIQATPKPKNQQQQECKEETSTTILKYPSTDLNLSESTAMAISGHGGAATPEQQLGNFQTGVMRPVWLSDDYTQVHVVQQVVSGSSKPSIDPTGTGLRGKITSS
ncbi:hypothetical protein HAX54_004816, partial [Datura stramonium]|nr:hypothetical protein [Datura stramonium]